MTKRKQPTPKGEGEKQTAENRIGKGKPGPGRPKGVPNKTTTLLKDAILQAATAAGGENGLVGYLTVQAATNPQSFLPLLGKVLPMQVTGEDGGPVRITHIELVALGANDESEG
jgi:hypothetical protein